MLLVHHVFRHISAMDKCGCDVIDWYSCSPNLSFPFSDPNPPLGGGVGKEVSDYDFHVTLCQMTGPYSL